MGIGQLEYERRKREHLCVECQRRCLDDKTLCRFCAAKQSGRSVKYNRKNQTERAAANLCTKCGGPRDGHQIHCSSCRAKELPGSAIQRAKRKTAGLCATGGCPNLRVQGRSSCRGCIAKLKAWCADNKERVRINNERMRTKLRQNTLNHYGNKCICCGEDTYEFLTLDHINNDGAKHRREMLEAKRPHLVGASRKQIRAEIGYVGGQALYMWLKKNGYPPIVQILCWNCNCAKGHYKICPHEVRKRREGFVAI